MTFLSHLSSTQGPSYRSSSHQDMKSGWYCLPESGTDTILVEDPGHTMPALALNRFRSDNYNSFVADFVNIDDNLDGTDSLPFGCDDLWARPHEHDDRSPHQKILVQEH